MLKLILFKVMSIRNARLTLNQVISAGNTKKVSKVTHEPWPAILSVEIKNKYSL